MPLLFHGPFVLSRGNVADFLNYDGTIARTNESDCYLANSLIFKL